MGDMIEARTVAWAARKRSTNVSSDTVLASATPRSLSSERRPRRGDGRRACTRSSRLRAKLSCQSVGGPRHRGPPTSRGQAHRRRRSPRRPGTAPRPSRARRAGRRARPAPSDPRPPRRSRSRVPWAGSSLILPRPDRPAGRYGLSVDGRIPMYGESEAEDDPRQDELFLSADAFSDCVGRLPRGRHRRIRLLLAVDLASFSREPAFERALERIAAETIPTLRAASA